MSDQRFARLKSDPRFRRPRKKHNKVVIDDRFKDILTASKADKKVKSGGVDKYGRPISETSDKDNLRRFYRLETEEETQTVPDYARGEVLLESSDEEEQGDIHDDSDSGGVVTFGHHQSQPIPVTGDDADDAEVDLDESSFADLDAQAAAYNESHPEMQQAQIKPTHRLAVVNLDWDHVRASHLYKICSSVVSSFTFPTSDHIQNSSKRRPNNQTRGNIVSVRVYPSKFGQERMAREEKEGPPPEIFKKKLLDTGEEITPQSVYEVGDGNDYDEDALRNYQLERLRYYYAIITCDTVDTAMHIHAELEGAELERSANIFDLSFVPDDMNFDDFCRDEVTSDSNTEFKAVDFVTDALRHSKVKLTWDDDDPERKRITRRTLTKAEIEESDFKALLASSSSDSDSEVDVPNVMKPPGRSENNLTKASRQKLRALLLGGDDELPEGWSGNTNTQGEVDMEITFTPGLTERKDHDESTLDKYQRKIREKRKKKKGEMKEKTLGLNSGLQDEFFDDGNGSDRASKPSTPLDNAQKPQMSSGTVSFSTPEELKLLVASNTLDTEPKHFNIKSILKAEKDLSRKRRNRKKPRNEDDQELQNDFSIDVKDLRFKALHDDHHYAIDPSNPQFMRTKSMTALLEERTRRQKETRVVDMGDVTVREPIENAGRGLTSLVESVKRKSATLAQPGAGKRRKG